MTTTPENQTNMLQQIPDGEGWHAGNPATGPIETIAMVNELGRTELAARLTASARHAFDEQFGFNKASEEFRQFEAEVAGNFLAGALETVTKSDLPEDEKKQKAQDILSATIEGTYRGVEFDVSYDQHFGMGLNPSKRETDNLANANMFGRKSQTSRTKLQRRIGLSRLIMEDAEAAEYLIASGTIGLHGTRSGALDSVLTDGLMTTRSAYQQGKKLVSGELIFNHPDGQKSVSMVGWQGFEGLKSYAGDGPRLTSEHVQTEIDGLERLFESYENNADPTLREKIRDPNNLRVQANRKKIDQLHHVVAILKDPATSTDYRERLETNYPVIFGVNRGVLDQPPYYPGGDVDGEFMITHDVGQDNISLILVPESHIEDAGSAVSKLGLDVRVDSLEPYRKAFNFRLQDYYTDRP